MKKYFALILAALMLVAAFAGCGGGGSNKTAQASGWVNAYFSTAPTTMNYFASTSGEVGELVLYTSAAIYREFLSEDGKSFTITPEIAADLPKQVDAEGKVWDIPIREGMKFENGDVIDANTVVYTFEKLFDPNLVNARAASKINSSQFSIVNAAEFNLGQVPFSDVGIEAVDANTVRFTGINPVSQGSMLSYLSCFCVVNPTCFNANLHPDGSLTYYGTEIDKFVSSGPFILKEWGKDAKFTLERNPDYLYADKIHIQGINYSVIPDAQTAVEKFLLGEIDYVSISYAMWEAYEDDPRVHEYFNDSLMYMFVNTGNPNQNNLLGSKDFRKALYYGMDRVELCNAIGGYPSTRYVRKAVLGNVSTGTAFIDMPGSNDYIDDPLKVYDIAKAKDHFSKALEEKKLSSATMEIMVSETATRTRALNEVLMVQYNNAFDNKLTTTLRTVPAGQTLTLRRWQPDNPTSYETTIGSLLPSALVLNDSFVFFTSTYNPPRFQWTSKEFDALYDQSCTQEAALDNALYVSLCQKMEKMILDEMVVVPVYETPDKVLVSERIQLASDTYVTGWGFGYPCYVSIVE